MRDKPTLCNKQFSIRSIWLNVANFNHFEPLGTFGVMGKEIQKKCLPLRPVVNNKRIYPRCAGNKAIFLA